MTDYEVGRLKWVMFLTA